MIDAFHLATTHSGYATERRGESLFFTTLGMELRFERLYTKETVTCIKVTVIHPELLRDGLYELAFGHGETETERDRFAASAWMNVDFPVIHAYLCPDGDDLGVQRSNMTSQTGSTQIAWKILLGQVDAVSDPPKTETEDRTFDMLKVVFNTLTNVLNTPRVLTLKFFVSKFSDGTIDVDCRLNGELWEEGMFDLFVFAKEMPLEGKMQWYKQFLIIYPHDAIDLKAGTALSNDLQDRHKEMFGSTEKGGRQKKWYRFWE